jgi:hypothetical protein
MSNFYIGVGSSGMTITSSRSEMTFILIGGGDVNDTCSVSTRRLNISSLGSGKNGCDMGLAKNSTTGGEGPRYP